MVPVGAGQASERGKQPIVILGYDVSELNNKKQGQNPYAYNNGMHTMAVPTTLYLVVRPIHQEVNQTCYWKPGQLSDTTGVKDLRVEPTTAPLFKHYSS